ncbi:Slp family lipoprotein [Bowmanella denitrificans]|nr:Slp family lipoprotein [Bowmanella denitrificans]
MKKLMLVTFVLAIAGCSTLPKDLQVAEGAKLLNYQEVAAQPQQSSGGQVLWGGVIADVKNKADATVLEMVHYPIRSYGRPTTDDESVGRFRVYVDGFLDPMVYKPGRSLTVSGAVTGSEEGQVGEYKYQFPTLKANGYHLWKDVQEVEVSTMGYGYGPYPYNWWGWHMWPYHERVIIRSKSKGYVDGPLPNRAPQSSNSPAPKKVTR